eukprot:207082_1
MHTCKYASTWIYHLSGFNSLTKRKYCFGKPNNFISIHSDYVSLLQINIIPSRNDDINSHGSLILSFELLFFSFSRSMPLLFELLLLLLLFGLWLFLNLLLLLLFFNLLFLLFLLLLLFEF